MKICERCGKEYDGSYGSGRFCSKSCAYSREFTEDQRKNISVAMSHYHKTHEVKHKKFIVTDYICERCGAKHDGSYGTGRYCSSYCQHNTLHETLTFYDDNENRIWKEIPFASTYYVSNFGEIAKFVNGMYAVVGTCAGRNGYRNVVLCIGGKKKRYQVHRLVLLSFEPVDNPEDLEVNHKDENTSNNNLSNLEWCNHKYNSNYGTGHIRSSEAQMERVMCVETGVIYKSLTEAANQNNVKIQSMSACCNGKTNTCNGFHWKFVDRL